MGKAGLDAQVAERIYLSSITLAELLFGIGILAAGRREDALATTLDGLLEVFGARILPFDSAAARIYADLAARARAAGQGLTLPDGYIAATAADRGYAVATRDDAPFIAAGVRVINPWVVA